MARSSDTPTKYSIRRVASNAAAVSACSFLAACSTGGNDIASIYTITKNVFQSPAVVTFDQAAAIPYASIGVRLGNSPQIMIVLASDNNGEQLWTSASHVAILTRNGRIMRTAGLGHDLGGTQTFRESPLTTRWIVDYPELSLYGVDITCQRSSETGETVTVLGKKIRAQRVDEECHAKQIDWTFTNTFWRDPISGLVWKSVQHVNPKLDALETETLRPPT